LREYYARLKTKLEEERGIELKHYFIVGIREDSVIEERA